MNETTPKESDLDLILINEVQLVLAEKRTALCYMRVGIAIFAFPLSVLSVLIATSKAYRISEVLHWLILLGILNVALIALGIYLIVYSFRRIHHCDQVIQAFKRQHSQLARLIR